MHLNLRSLIGITSPRVAAKPATIGRAPDDEIATQALELLKTASEPLEIMVTILAKHEIPRGNFVLYADLADLTGVPDVLPEEVEIAYNAARSELEGTIYGRGIPAAAIQRALEIIEKTYFR